MLVPIIEERAIMHLPEISSPDPQTMRFTLDVIHVAPHPLSSDKTSSGTIKVFVATSASCLVSKTQASLKSGDSTLPVAPSQTFLHNLAKKDESGTLVHLSYRGRLLVSLRFASCQEACGTELPFWGEILEPQYVEAELRRNNDDRSIDVLVVVQPLFRSQMEQEVNRQVPVALSELGALLLFGPKPVLLVMEEGWAIGSYLAKIAALRIHRKRQNSESANDKRKIKSMRLSPPTESVDLKVPAKVLVHRYLGWLRSRRSK